MIKKYHANIIFFLVVTFLLVAIESYFRYSVPSLSLFTGVEEYLYIIIIVLLTTFSNKKLAFSFLIFIFTFVTLEIAHYRYFGNLIFPMEIYLGFTKQSEIFDTLSSMLNILTIPAVILFVSLVTIFLIADITKERKTYRWVTIIFIIMLLFPIIRTAIGYKKTQLGARPNEYWSLARNTVHTVDHFLGKTLPLLLLNRSSVDAYSQKPFILSSKDKPIAVQNVILIIGESLTREHMSLYNYDKNTTPYLDQLKKDKNFIFKKGIPAGVVTDSSIPMIVNVAQRCNALMHIISAKTNLFRLAQKQGYVTHFISAQSQEAFKYIRTYLNQKYIDNYVDSSNYGYNYYTNANDTLLLNEIKKIDFSKHNFIVLNMSGSHSPYTSRVPKDYAPFTKKTLNNQYDNTVRYSDTILNQLFNYIQEQNSSSVLFMTSDHGEFVSEHHGCGHGNLKRSSVCSVPILYKTFHHNISDETRNYFKSSNFMSHYKMSLYIAHMLGYQLPKRDIDCQVYINGRDLAGNDGYLKVTLDKKSILKKELHQ
jgi:glucan phosphoethanolaminetransferase (alkaline phosphatase superfamily)